MRALAPILRHLLAPTHFDSTLKLTCATNAKLIGSLHSMVKTVRPRGTFRGWEGDGNSESSDYDMRWSATYGGWTGECCDMRWSETYGGWTGECYCVSVVLRWPAICRILPDPSAVLELWFWRAGHRVVAAVLCTRDHCWRWESTPSFVCKLGGQVGECRSNLSAGTHSRISFFVICFGLLSINLRCSCKSLWRFLSWRFFSSCARLLSNTLPIQCSNLCRNLVCLVVATHLVRTTFKHLQ